MPKELEIPYQERIATVVGGRGVIGSKVVTCFEDLDYKRVDICEKGDRFLDFVNGSTDLFLAVDDEEGIYLLSLAMPYLRPEHTIMDSASNKTNAIELYRAVDVARTSISPGHLGASPKHPWGGVKYWLCRVGPNSDRAIRTGMDLFVARNVSIDVIDIEEHENVEMDQFITFSTAYAISDTLRQLGIPLSVFDRFATLNAELLAQPTGRSLGQGVKIPSEVMTRQKRRFEIIDAIQDSLERLREALKDRTSLEEFMQENIDYHDNPEGYIQRIFKRAGVIGARNANMRLYSFSFRITDDASGKLREVLLPFHLEGANITGLDSMSGVITEEEVTSGVDPDRIVDFDIAIDPKTINADKERRIKERLVEMGCTITVNND